jgi:hypothetical protein
VNGVFSCLCSLKTRLNEDLGVVTSIFPKKQSLFRIKIAEISVSIAQAAHFFAIF